jgi:heat shock protein HslJ
MSLGVLAALVLTGCGNGTSSSSEPASFESIPWTLVSGLPASADGATPGATFAHGIIGGSAGCNHFTAPYTVDGDKLEIGTIATTKMACPPPQAAVEHAYLAALGKVASWSIDGDELVLSDGDGNELLRYGTPSIDGDYEATAIRTVDAFASPIPGTTITAKFAAGTITGSGGCNTYTASYTTDRGSIHVDTPAATKKLCTDPAGVSEQEANYFAALAAADQYRLDGPHALALMAADGTYLVSFAQASG